VAYFYLWEALGLKVNQPSNGHLIPKSVHQQITWGEFTYDNRGFRHKVQEGWDQTWEKFVNSDNFVQTLHAGDVTGARAAVLAQLHHMETGIRHFKQYGLDHESVRPDEPYKSMDRVSKMESLSGKLRRGEEDLDEKLSTPARRFNLARTRLAELVKGIVNNAPRFTEQHEIALLVSVESTISVAYDEIDYHKRMLEFGNGVDYNAYHQGEIQRYTRMANAAMEFKDSRRGNARDWKL